MTRRTAVPLLVSLVAPGAACSGDRPAGPLPPAQCGARATQITLAVGAYVSIDPASDSGCVVFPANASADSTEYLVIAQSVAASPSESSSFQLRGAALGAVAAPAAATQAAPAPPQPVAAQFDGFLRSLARTRTYSVPTVGRPSLAATVSPGGAAAAGPLTLSSLRTFTVCATLTCSSFQNVGARVKAVGVHIAIYVDTLAPAGGLDSADVDTLKQVFDSRLYPLDTASLAAFPTSTPTPSRSSS